MRVLLCGTRTYSDFEKIEAAVAQLPAGSVVIHGAAHGKQAERFYKVAGSWSVLTARAETEGPPRVNLFRKNDGPGMGWRYIDSSMFFYDVTQDELEAFVAVRKLLQRYQNGEIDVLPASDAPDPHGAP